MRRRGNDFWGKLSSDHERWHPLIDHCADVAACCEALLRTTLLRRRLARIGGLKDLNPAQVARLCVLAAYHDFGKFNLGFQNKALERSPFTNGHVREALALFSNRYPDSKRLYSSLALNEIERWGSENCAIRLLIAAVAHHGKPADLADCERKYHAPQWRPAQGLDPFDGISRLAAHARSWYPTAFATSADPLPAASALQHAFSGLVTLADWLGSDTHFFPFSEDGDVDRMVFAREASRRAILSVGIDTNAARAAMGTAKPAFSMVSPFEPRTFQRSILELPAGHGGSLTILEAETGSGKTEAAFGRFLSLFHAGEVDGLYFALPTRTAATQIHVRMRAAVTRAFAGAAAAPPVILAVPGYLRFDDLEGRRLPGFEVLWNDDPDERRRYLGWAAENPKRYLAGAIAVGTVDQVLLSTLMVSHAHMRATSLMRQLLVVDEVHASDAYMIAILREVLANHLAAGGHALLMSATLGAGARHALLSRLSSGATALPAVAEAKQVPYPMLACYRDGGVTERAEQSGSEPRNVEAEIRPWADDYAAVARAALDAAATGARILFVRNTVSGCIATQQELERAADVRGARAALFACKQIVTPHHSRFAAPDRIDLDRALEASFGLKSPTAPCVAVATQTVQQSLDIDADLLITDLCPMDVLLQRIGRLHRHNRLGRPASCASPRVIVLTPAERDLTPMIRAGGEARGPHGLGTVYEDLRILEATWRALEEHAVISIPGMNRTLVEETTHPEALRAIATSLGPVWESHGVKVSGAQFAMKRLAALNCIDRTLPFGDFEFPSSELEQRIQTRLGEGDRIAQFDAPITSPFGNSINSLSIPSFLARGVDKDALPVLISVGDGTVEFSFGPYRYVYDRLGLRRVNEPGSESEVPSDG